MVLSCNVVGILWHYSLTQVFTALLSTFSKEFTGVCVTASVRHPAVTQAEAPVTRESRWRSVCVSALGLSLPVQRLHFEASQQHCTHKCPGKTHSSLISSLWTSWMLSWDHPEGCWLLWGPLPLPGKFQKDRGQDKMKFCISALYVFFNDKCQENYSGNFNIYLNSGTITA